jgi:ABC-2 type transport system permease protein
MTSHINTSPWAKISAYLACASLALRQQLEYRLNFVMDVLIQPGLTACIEVAIWYSLLQSFDGQLGGYSRQYYLQYALWAAFFARQMGTWTYDFTIASEIQTGSINALLTRPLSYFEFQFFQFMGQKLVSLMFAVLAPALASIWFFGGVEPERLLVAVLFGIAYLIFGFTLLFLISSLGFFMTRIHSLIVAKNIGLWLLTGEVFPLDLLPERIAVVAKMLPTASGVYLPVGYLTGRVSEVDLHRGALGVGIGIFVAGTAAAILWRIGLRRYTGVGA